MRPEQLPPLNALRAFEAAARHGGFIGAADELCVTRGAISRQVKLLESHLGVALFVRQAQGVRLTTAGRRLLPVLSDAFGLIAKETQRITQDMAELRIICPPATSIRWLLPRLNAFRELHPDIQVRLTTDFHGAVGFDHAEYDIGFSVESWPNRSQNTKIIPLFPVLLTPACAPSYLNKHPLPTPEALSGCEILHETPRRADWTDWLKASAVKGFDPKSEQDFPNLDMAVKAAVMGAGVVMADLILCREEFEAQTLIAPFPELTCASSFGDICLIADSESLDTPKVKAFTTWATDSARRDRAVLSI